MAKWPWRPSCIKLHILSSIWVCFWYNDRLRSNVCDCIRCRSSLFIDCSNSPFMDLWTWVELYYFIYMSIWRRIWLCLPDTTAVVSTVQVHSKLKGSISIHSAIIGLINGRWWSGSGEEDVVVVNIKIKEESTFILRALIKSHGIGTHVIRHGPSDKGHHIIIGSFANSMKGSSALRSRRRPLHQITAPTVAPLMSNGEWPVVV